jgi:hypothetical protein
MNGYNNLMLPFGLNFREVVENKEAVLNGLSTIQRFFDGNIWLPLGANVESLFVRGVVGATEGLCDWCEVPASWPPFEPEKWEEKEHLWYVLASGSFYYYFLNIFHCYICLFVLFFLFFFVFFFFFFCCCKKATGRFPPLSRGLFCCALQDSLVVRILARRFSSVSRNFSLSAGSSRGRPLLRIVFCATAASGLARRIRIL